MDFQDQEVVHRREISTLRWSPWTLRPPVCNTKISRCDPFEFDQEYCPLRCNGRGCSCREVFWLFHYCDFVMRKVGRFWSGFRQPSLRSGVAWAGWFPQWLDEGVEFREQLADLERFCLELFEAVWFIVHENGVRFLKRWCRDTALSSFFWGRRRVFLVIPISRPPRSFCRPRCSGSPPRTRSCGCVWCPSWISPAGRSAVGVRAFGSARDSRSFSSWYLRASFALSKRMPSTCTCRFPNLLPPFSRMNAIKLK